MYVRKNSTIIRPTNVTKKRMSTQIQHAYEQWKQKYLKVIESNPNLFYIEYDDKGSTVSEALGFGMLTMVRMNLLNVKTKDYFDGMFRYVKEFPSDANHSLMAWKQVRNPNGSMINVEVGYTYSATDADMDIACALILADKQWGSEHEINYKQEANIIISAIMNSIVNKNEWTLKLGDWVKDDDEKYGTASRTSDWMLGHLQLFYQETGDERWKKIILKIVEMISFLQHTYSPTTGLLPDFVWKKNGVYSPVQPYFLEAKYDPYYNYNACRLPLRLGEGYYMLQNATLKKQIDKINGWVKDSTRLDSTKIMAGYQLDGSPLTNYSDMAFIAPFAVSASVGCGNQRWLNILWKRMTENYHSIYDSNYYNDSLRLLAMISIMFSGTDANSSG